LHLSRGAAERAELKLSPVTLALPGFSGVVPYLGDSVRHLGPCHGGRHRPEIRRASESRLRDPRYSSNDAAAPLARRHQAMTASRLASLEVLVHTEDTRLLAAVQWMMIPVSIDEQFIEIAKHLPEDWRGLPAR